MTAVLIYVTPYLEKDGTLPFPAWIPDGIHYAYESIYILEGLLFAIYVPIIIAFDCIFASICVQVIIQLRMVQDRLRNIKFYEKENKANKAEYMKKIKECVRHHVFLLR